MMAYCNKMNILTSTDISNHLIKLTQNLLNITAVLKQTKVSIKDGLDFTSVENNLITLQSQLSQITSSIQEFSNSTSSHDISLFDSIQRIMDVQSFLALLSGKEGSLFSFDSKIAGITTGLGKMAAGTKAASIGLKLLGGAASAGIFLVLSLAIQSLTEWLNKCVQEQQEAIKSTQEHAESIQNLNRLEQEYLNIINSPDDQVKKEQELVKWKEKVIEQYDLEKKAIDKVNLSRQTGLNLIGEEKQRQFNKWMMDSYSTYMTAVEKIESGSEKFKGNQYSITLPFTQDEFQSINGVLHKNNISVKQLDTIGYNAYLYELNFNSNNLIDQLTTLEQIMSGLKSNPIDSLSTWDYFSPTGTIGLEDSDYERLRFLEALTNDYNDLEDAIKDYVDIYEQGNLIMASGVLEASADKMSDVVDQNSFNKFKTELLETNEFGEGFKETLSELIDETFPQFSKSTNISAEYLANLYGEISNYQSRLQLLSTAQNEYNQTGAISANTFKQLYDNNLLEFLDNSTGKLRVNQKGLLNQAEAAKAAAIDALRLAASQDIQNLAIGNVDALSDTAKTAISNLGNAIQQTGTQVDGTAGKLAGLGGMIQILQNGAVDPVSFHTQANAIVDSYKNIATSISGISFTPNDNFNSTPSGFSTDTWLEAYDKAKAELDHRRKMGVISEEDYLNELRALNDKYFKDREKYHDQYRDNLVEIRGLEESLTKEKIADIDEEISALEKEENTYDDQLDLVYQQRDAINAAIEDARAKGYDTESEYYKSLEKLMDENLEKEKSIIDARREYEQEAFLEGLEGYKDRIASYKDQEHGEISGELMVEEADAALQKIQERIDQLRREDAKANKEEIEKLEDEYDELYDSRLEGLQMILDAEKKQIDESISAAREALEKERKATEEYYNEEIKAYKRKHEEQEKINTLKEKELQLENLKKQRNVLTYMEGQGFVYTADTEAVEAAQEDLDKTREEYEYQAELQRMEDAKEQALQAIDDELAKLDEQQEFWDQYFEDFELNSATAQSIHEEWAKNQGEQFVNQTVAIIEYANTYTAQLERMIEKIRELNALEGGMELEGELTGASSDRDSSDRKSSKNRYASGSRYVPASGTYLVNENGPEAIFKPGTGTYEYLPQGTVVFSAAATRNLWNWSKLNPARALSLSNLPQITVPQVNSISIGDVILNGVQDTDRLSREIVNRLPLAMQQEFYKR